MSWCISSISWIQQRVRERERKPLGKSGLLFQSDYSLTGHTNHHSPLNDALKSFTHRIKSKMNKKYIFCTDLFQGNLERPKTFKNSLETQSMMLSQSFRLCCSMKQPSRTINWWNIHGSVSTFIRQLVHVSVPQRILCEIFPQWQTPQGLADLMCAHTLMEFTAVFVFSYTTVGIKILET